MLQGKIKYHPDMEKALWADSYISYGGRKPKNIGYFGPEDCDGSQYPFSRATKNFPKSIEFNVFYERADPSTTVLRFNKSNVKEYLGGISDKQINEFTKMCSEHYLSKNSLKTSSEATLKTIHGELNSPLQDADPPNVIENNAKPYEVRVSSVNLGPNKTTPTDPKEKTPTVKKNKKPYKNKKTIKDKSSTADSTTITEHSAGLGKSSDEPIGAAQTARAAKDEGEMAAKEEGEIPLNTTAILPMPTEELLEPGIDILIKIRIYKPFDYESYQKKPDNTLCNLFYHDMTLTGRNKVSDIKDHFVCNEKVPDSKNKLNGFLFIKNGFYVDNNMEAADYADALRQWCVSRNFGEFPRHDMRTCSMEDLEFKLGHPDVYIHENTCEHIIIFSEVRLVNANDPLYLSQYPRITSVSENQKAPFCYNCAGLNPKWIVSGCIRIPFNKALFCQECLKKLLYSNDGKKICKFKAYPYKNTDAPESVDN